MQNVIKKFCYSLLLAFIFVTIARDAQASQPPPETTLAERVDMASKIVVGTAKKLRVVDVKDGQLQEVTPEPELMENRQLAEIEIEVEEVLYPAAWQPKTTVRLLFGGGFFNVASIRTNTIGQKHIYLMKSLRGLVPEEEYKATKKEGEEDVFLPAYSWYLAESLKKKDEIIALVAARVKREDEQKAKSTPPAK